MSDIVTGIKLKGDASGLVGESKRARDEMDRFKRSTGQAGREARNTATSVRTFSAANNHLVKSLREIFSPINLVRGGLSSLIAALGIKEVVRFSDEIKRLDNQLKLVTKTSEERVTILRQLLTLSDETYAKVSATTELYARMHRATKELNLSQAQLLAVTRAVNQSYVISGASTEEAAGSTRQLSQALASGAFRGDEFNSVAEQAPRLMEALATELGKTTGELRKMAENGELTSQKLIAALVNQSTTIQNEFNKMAPTAGQALTVVGNNLRILVSEVNSATGDFGGLTNTILNVAESLRTLSQMIASGELLGTLSAYASAWSGWAKTVEDSINIASDAVAQFPLTVIAAQALTEESLGFLGDAFKYFPQNVLAMVKAITVELATLERVAPLYFQRFGYQVENELKEAVSIAEVYAKELVDKMNPFDGDTFDLNGELANVEAHYAARGQKVDDFFNKKINASWAARESTLQDIFDERQASISSMNAQLAAAKALATARRNSAAANDNQFDQPEKIEAPALSEAQQQANFAALNKAYLSQEELLQQHAQEEMATIAKAMAEKRITEQQGLDLIYAARVQHQAKLKTLEEQRGRENGVNADGQSVFEQLRERFATQEELLQIHAQREMDIIAQAMQNKQVTEQQGLNLILSARRQHLGEVQALETQKANLIYSSAAQTFDDLASLTKTFSGEQSKAYKVLFAISKGFAISQGIMNLSTAISNAAALPWPANIPAMAQAAATGTSLIANIKGATLKGQAHEGLDKNVREGTWWLRNDEMVLNPRQRRGFENMVAANDGGQFAAGGNSRSLVFKPTISIDATNAVPGMEQRINDAVLQGQMELYAKLQEDFASGGELSQTMRNLA